MKLTGTNSSIGLIVLIVYVHLDAEKHQDRMFAADLSVVNVNTIIFKNKFQLLETKQMLHFADLVVMAGPLTPVPIPNTAVKCPCADGTLS